jgi:hypothetical protein
MKKIVSLMLGLALVTGAIGLADEKKTTKSTAKSTKQGGKKKNTTTRRTTDKMTMSNPK